MTISIESELKLPCGAVLPNRLCKAAMTEGLADEMNRTTEKHVNLYRRWSLGGAGLLISGNVQVDRRYLERAGNIAIDNNGGLDQLKALARAGTEGGNHFWMQISHPGRQVMTSVNRNPVAPSAVPMDLGKQFADPRALNEAEILEIIEKFAFVAKTAKECGFTGVQVHGAHGYLISQFLSPVSNIRTDRWGGSLENRARLLLEVVRSVREAVGVDYPVGVKLNSADFQKGGFGPEDALQVVQWLNEEKIDLLEVSGGTYEQPQMMGTDGIAGQADQQMAASTKRREAYFLEYAKKIETVAEMPLMVTGGFRTRLAMDDALNNGETEVVGLARPLCVDPDCAGKLLRRDIEKLPSHEKNLRIGPGIFGPASSIQLFKMMNGWGAQGWFCLQILRMGDGKEPDLASGAFRSLIGYQKNESAAGKRRAAATPGIDQ